MHLSSCSVVHRGLPLFFLFWLEPIRNILVYTCIFFNCLAKVTTSIFPQACEKDRQCGAGMCCAVSLWFRSLRMCAPMGREDDQCHPLSHKVGRCPDFLHKSFACFQAPFSGRRLHHMCPCQPHLACITVSQGISRCLSPFKAFPSLCLHQLF
uniref:Prokineticin domain-containing protein n=1 Tax=Esox lucius TaxID=8010 RepID=A0A3P8ZGC2_ESOLU